MKSSTANITQMRDYLWYTAPRSFPICYIVDLAYPSLGRCPKQFYGVHRISYFWDYDFILRSGSFSLAAVIVGIY
jgi:hypothetical protein